MSANELLPSSVVLRSATIADANALSRFAARVFRETFDAVSSAADMEAYLRESYSPAIQAQEIADSQATLFLAEDHSAPGDALIGFAHFTEDDASTSIELRRIYVDARWQGRGLAKRLWTRLSANAAGRGTKRLWLSVWHRNHRAIAFYKKTGFRISGEMTFHWGSDIEAGFLMEMAALDRERAIL